MFIKKNTLYTFLISLCICHACILRWSVEYCANYILLVRISLIMGAILLFPYLKVLFKQKYQIFNIFVLLIVISIFMSAFVNRANYISSMWNGMTYVMQLILFAWFCEYLDTYDRIYIGIKCLFSIVFIYCVVADLLMLLSPYKIYYVDGSFSYMTIIGDKFSLTYLHLIATALYYSFIQNKDRKDKKVKLIILILLTLFISIYTQCSTMIVGIILFTILLFYRKNTINILSNPIFLLIYTFICNTILLLNDAVMNISFIKYFIENILHESVELTGRIGIYRSLSAVANINPILGVGLDNNYIVSKYITGAADVQNGIMDIFLSYGGLGVVVLICFMIYVVKRKGNNSGDALLITIYVFITLSSVEITFRKSYLIVLFLNVLCGWYNSNKVCESEVIN